MQDSRNRNISTFIKQEDLLDQQLDKMYSETVLVIGKVTDPNDILWKNMTGHRGLFIFRRVFLVIAGLAIILFISSPASIYANVKQMDKSNILDFNWIGNTFIANFMRSNTPPFLIILINQLLLILIDITSRIECYETHALYQRAIYYKSVIYLMLNMIIIPTLSLSAGTGVTSIWSYIQKKDIGFSELLGDLYLGNTGQFYVSLVI